MRDKFEKRTKIIAEVHPQHYGSIENLERIIISCKYNGADFVKLQLYSTQDLFSNNDRLYLEFTFEELKHIKNYCDKFGIKLFASVFDEERLDWCNKLDFEYYKIASRTVEDIDLCKKILSLNKKTIISLGMYDYKNKEIPFREKNIEYLYCVSKYPAALEEIEMPDFHKNSMFSGYSDHTVGIYAALKAISNGASYIEKHFSNNKSLNTKTEMAHICSMDGDDLSFLRKCAESFCLINK